MHLLDRVVCDITVPNESLAEQVQTLLSGYVNTAMPDVVDNALDSGRVRDLLIDRLEIEIGDVPLEHLLEEISRALFRVLGELPDHAGTETAPELDMRQPADRSAAEQIADFLRTGETGGWSGSDSFDLRAALNALAHANKAECMTVLRDIWKLPQAADRLVFHLAPVQLLSLLRAIDCTELADFAVRFAALQSSGSLVAMPNRKVLRKLHRRVLQEAISDGPSAQLQERQILNTLAFDIGVDVAALLTKWSDQTTASQRSDNPETDGLTAPETYGGLQTGPSAPPPAAGAAVGEEAGHPETAGHLHDHYGDSVIPVRTEAPEDKLKPDKVTLREAGISSEIPSAHPPAGDRITAGTQFAEGMPDPDDSSAPEKAEETTASFGREDIIDLATGRASAALRRRSKRLDLVHAMEGLISAQPPGFAAKLAQIAEQPDAVAELIKRLPWQTLMRLLNLPTDQVAGVIEPLLRVASKLDTALQRAFWVGAISRGLQQIPSERTHGDLLWSLIVRAADKLDRPRGSVLNRVQEAMSGPDLSHDAEFKACISTLIAAQRDIRQNPLVQPYANEAGGITARSSAACGSEPAPVAAPAPARSNPKPASQSAGPPSPETDASRRSEPDTKPLDRSRHHSEATDPVEDDRPTQAGTTGFTAEFPVNPIGMPVQFGSFAELALYLRYGQSHKAGPGAQRDLLEAALRHKNKHTQAALACAFGSTDGIDRLLSLVENVPDTSDPTATSSRAPTRPAMTLVTQLAARFADPGPNLATILRNYAEILGRTRLLRAAEALHAVFRSTIVATAIKTQSKQKLVSLLPMQIITQLIDVSSYSYQHLHAVLTPLAGTAPVSETQALANALRQTPLTPTSEPVVEATAKKERKRPEPGTAYSVPNGGAILLWPFLSQYFSTLELARNNVFASTEAQMRAMHLVHYLSMGQIRLDERVFALSKILVGLALEDAIDPEFQPSEQEVEIGRGMLTAVTQNWPGLENTSVNTLRETFLSRPARLIFSEGETPLSLYVEKRPYDMLLSRIPWSIGLIRLSWMEHALHVHWEGV